MRLAELSRRSDVSIETIKYYLRSGLLPPGERITATEADYGEHHLHRLRLIRALICLGRLSVSAAKEILDAVASEQDDLGPVVAKALNVASAAREGGQAEDVVVPTTPDVRGLMDARSLIAEMGWCVPSAAPAARELGQILDTLTELGVDIGWQALLPYAQLADKISDLDSDQIHAGAGPLPLAECAAVVTVLLEPVLLTLRRLALEDKTLRRNGEEPVGVHPQNWRAPARHLGPREHGIAGGVQCPRDHPSQDYGASRAPGDT